LAGLFPVSGFWSKDEILVGTGGWGFFGASGANGAYTFHLIMGMVGAALTGAYMTRVIYLTFFGEFRGHGTPHESGRRITVPLWILAGFAVFAGLLNMPKGFQLWPDAWELRFEHFVEPVNAAFPPISHAVPSWSLAIAASIVGIAGIAASYYYYFVRVDGLARKSGESLTEVPNGPVTTNPLARAGHTLLVNKYYLDHLYTDIVVGGIKGPIARAAYWVNQHVIDATVDKAGTTSVAVGQTVYDRIDQMMIDGTVNGVGRVSDSSGEELRHVQTGRVQQYATILFAAAAVLAGVFVVLLAL